MKEKIMVLVGLFLLVSLANAVTPKTMKLYPTDDTKVDEVFPFNNYGPSKSLEVRNGTSLFGKGWEIDSLLKFDLSSIPKNATILSAELRLYYYKWRDTNPAGRELSLYEISSDWNEDDVNWNNKPAYAEKVATAIVPSTEGRWISWNVKNSVEKILNGRERYGWVIKDEKVWGSANIPYIFFYSKENANNKPYLSIKYKLAGGEEKEKKGIPGWEIFILCAAFLIAFNWKQISHRNI